MGAKHPQQVLNQLGAQKNHFVLAARHIIRKGLAKTPADAIRYMEANNTNVENIIEEIIQSKMAPVVTEEESNPDDQAE